MLNPHCLLCLVVLVTVLTHKKQWLKGITKRLLVNLAPYYIAARVTKIMSRRTRSSWLKCVLRDDEAVHWDPVPLASAGQQWLVLGVVLSQYKGVLQRSSTEWATMWQVPIYTFQSVFSSISLIQNLDLSTQNWTLDPLPLHVLVVQISQFELSTLLKPNSLLPPDCKFEH